MFTSNADSGKLVAMQQPERGEVKDRVGLLQRLGEQVGMEDVPTQVEQLHAGVAQR